MKISTTYSIFITLLLIVNCFLCFACSEKLVIDTDGGADDAAAILLALSAWKNNDSNFEVVAITCANGNTVLETVEQNVLKIQVYGGANRPLVEEAGTDFYFGADGLGDFIFNYPRETVVNADIEKSWRMYKLGFTNSTIMTFLNKAESKSLKDVSELWFSADLQTTAVMIWPHLSKKSIVTNVTPVIDGAARGSILVDYSKMSEKPENVEIVEQLDSTEFKKQILCHFFLILRRSWRE